MKKRYKVYLEDGFNEGLVDTLCDMCKHVDFSYGDKYIKYVGTDEGVEALKKLLETYGIKTKETT